MEADELRLVAGRIALQDGREALGRRLLGQIHGRATRWRARAELAKGGEVLRVCRRGLTARWDQELAEVGLGAALAGGDAATVLRWARRCRGDELAGPGVLEYFVHENRVWVGYRGRVHRLAEVAEVRQEVAGLRLGGGSVERLERLLLPAAGTGPVRVLAPVELAGVPWNGLPSLAGRAVSVLPPGWQPVEGAAGAPVWVAGPGLPGAVAEVRALHRRFGGRLLAGAQATVVRTVRAVAGAGLVHVAAHGRQGGWLELADGRVRVAELLPRAAGTVVLSACGVGRALGWARGVVVASVLEVADAGTGAMMLALHERLRREPPAAALAAVQRVHGHRGFVCVGQAVSLPRRSRASSSTSSRLQ
ncbi:CHAT domain-containing protein [Crossiella sp. S99.2]|nr:CHAT domain-containing protein [Crossiella sp. S99.2]MCK2250327.1 CHAT domain-containing protein [Crossiella sp. S99.1]